MEKNYIINLFKHKSGIIVSQHPEIDGIMLSSAPYHLPKHP